MIGEERKERNKVGLLWCKERRRRRKRRKGGGRGGLRFLPPPLPPLLPPPPPPCVWLLWLLWLLPPFLLLLLLLLPREWEPARKREASHTYFRCLNANGYEIRPHTFPSIVFNSALRSIWTHYICFQLLCHVVSTEPSRSQTPPSLFSIPFSNSRRGNFMQASKENHFAPSTSFLLPPPPHAWEPRKGPSAITFNNFFPPGGGHTTRCFPDTLR